jgi:hypothetical protein
MLGRSRICLLEALAGRRRRSDLTKSQLLTYMSPELSRLLSTGRIKPVAVRLGPRDQRQRQLFWTTEFETWSRLVAGQNGARGVATFAEQLNTAFADFISGRPLTSGLARCDPPKGEAIWRLKTPDLRLYGWADDFQCMVLACGELVKIIKAPGSPRDRDLGKNALGARRKLKLGCVYGERYEIFPAAR